MWVPNLVNSPNSILTRRHLGGVIPLVLLDTELHPSSQITSMQIARDRFLRPYTGIHLVISACSCFLNMHVYLNCFRHQLLPSVFHDFYFHKSAILDHLLFHVKYPQTWALLC